MDIRERNINNIIVTSFSRQIHERSAEGADAAERLVTAATLLEGAVRAYEVRGRARTAVGFC